MTTSDTTRLMISRGRESHADISSIDAMTWRELVELLTSPPPQIADKEQKGIRGWFCPATFDPPHRDSENFLERYALTLDYDHITPADLTTIIHSYEGFVGLLYTTWSHTKEAPRVRVILPTDRPMSYDEFQAVTRMVASWAGIELASRESHVPTQYMFLPAVKPDAKFTVKEFTGELLSVDRVLSQYEDWTKREQWPHRIEGDGTHKGEIQTKPADKPGIVGDFCRAFDVPQAIERFALPYVRTSNPGRWTYSHGSRPEGAIVYDDGAKFHSHHDTDPARGQTNAFDLVRLHRFAALDRDCVPGTAIAERPSYRAMARLAHEQMEVRGVQAAAEFEELGPEGPEPATPVTVGTAVRLELALAERPDGGTARRFRPVPADQFGGQSHPGWLVKRLIPRTGLGVIFGASGAGKSYTALDVACAISRGTPWRGRKVRKSRVVMVIAEGQGGFTLRLRAYSTEYSVPLSDLPAIIAEAPNLIEVPDVVELTKAILEYGGADMIIVDTLAASFQGNENAGEDMGKVIAHCKFLARKTGAFVWLVHHSGKDEAKGSRGWSGLKGAIDVEMSVTRAGDLRIVKVTKMKDGEEGDEFGFLLKEVILGKDEDGDDIKSCVIQAVDIPSHEALRSGKPEPTNPNQKAIRAAMRRLGGGPVSAVQLINTAVQHYTVKEEGVDRRRQDMRKAINALLRDEMLFKVDDREGEWYSNSRVTKTTGADFDEE